MDDYDNLSTVLQLQCSSSSSNIIVESMRFLLMNVQNVACILLTAKKKNILQEIVHAVQ